MVFPWVSRFFPWFSPGFSVLHFPPRPGDVVAVEVEGIGRLENTMLGGRGQSAIIRGDYNGIIIINMIIYTMGNMGNMGYMC